MHANLSIGQYLIKRLQAQGIRDVFGIPGDFVLGFYQMLEQSPLRVIGTCNELNAGYAADAYARLNGISAVCVTYNVGGLSLVNAVAGAYAEKSAMVVITGSPGMAERRGNPLLHHRVGAFSTQRDIFEKVTVAAVVLDDPETAFREIDRCLELARQHQRPVYIEIPRDMVEVVPPHPHKPFSLPRESEPEALREAIAEARELLGKAKRPVILAGLEVHRCRLGNTVMTFAEQHGIPICSTILSKSVIDERHPLYLGVYEGAMSREAVQRYVEDSDCLILLGVFMTDMELGIYTATLNPENWIFASLEDLRIRHHHFLQVQFADFVQGLAAAELPARSPPESLPSSPPRAAWKPVASAPVTNRRLFEKLDEILDDRMVVVCDVGDALFASVDLGTQGVTQFIGPAYYTSMGFAVPAALAVQVHDQGLRPLVIVGDGAFQMTGHELSSIARLGFNPIVLVLNNKGYTTERYLAEGSFNDIHPWHYHRLPEVFGSGLGLEVHTEDDLEQALARAVAHTGEFTIINIHLGSMDISPALERLTRGLREGL